MAKITWENLNINKLNKALKQAKKPNVLVGPRASKGSYGELANILSEKWSKNKVGQKGQQSRPGRTGRKGMGIAVKGGGRIL